ncbi:MAG: (2Fe-2S) ferredoxin domain-containing protein [Thainema sp.]
MLEPQQVPSGLFSIEGTFLGFLGKKPDKPRSIILEVEQEQLTIKLPKELRTCLQQHLQIGCRVRCIGSSQVDFEAGAIRLKAYQVFAIADFSKTESNSASTNLATVSPLSKVSAIPTQPQSGSQDAPRRTKRNTILVCRKSGCQKRGGRQMVVALEQALRQHQLHEHVEIKYTGCQKRCSKAPNLTIMPGKHHYDRLRAKDLSTIVTEHFCTSKLSSDSNYADL